MAKYVGRRAGIGLAKESVRGTAVSPTHWFHWMEVDVEDRDEVVLNESSLATIEASDGQTLVTEFSEGTFSGKVKSDPHGLLLLSLFGDVTSAVVETTAYSHTYAVGNDNQHDSLTVALKTPNQDVEFANVIVDRITYTYELGQYPMMEAHFLGLASAAATNTVTIAADEDFKPHHVTVKFAATKAGLGAAGATTVRSVNITIDAQAELDKVLGTTTPADVLNKSFKVEGEVTMVHDGLTQRDLVFNETFQAMRIELEDTTTTIGGSTNPLFRIDLAKCGFSEWTRSTGRDDIVTESFKFTAHYSVSDTEMIEVVLYNEETSY